jgi:methyl-accepting chemotaxis protein
MFGFHDYSIRKKLAASFGILLALISLIGIFSLVELARINNATREITQNRIFETHVLTSLQSGINIVRRNELMLLLASSPEDTSTCKTKLAKAVEDLNSTISDNQGKFEQVALPEDLALYREFLTQLAASNQLQDQVVAQRLAGNDEQAHQKAIAQQQPLHAMLEAIDKAVAQSTEGAHAAAERAEANYRRARTVTLVLLLLAIAVGFGFAIIVSNAIALPLVGLVDNFHQAAAGDLTTRIDASSQDEVGRVGTAFNEFMENLEDALRSVASNANKLAATTVHLNTRASSTADNAREESAKTTHIAAAAEEMSVTIGEISKNTESAVAASRQSAAAAEQGGTVMESTTATMERIASSSASVSDKMTSLALRSEEIGKVVNVIQEISEQTNLLALNAAIEAARAGEHGRGFAVVAGEVRRLAERTNGATGEIANTIRAMQDEARATLDLMDDSGAAINSGIQETNHARQSLQEIITASQHVEHQIQLIATAATQQTSASAEISRSAGEISILSVDNTRGAEETAEALKEISSLAGDLDGIISRFKLGNSGDRAR